MSKNSIFILGDSSSMTIGMEKRMYPFLMAQMECWPESMEIVNCSQPGFTAADASAFFFQQRKKNGKLKAVIIYVGNCDTMATEINKGRYTAFRQFKFNFDEKIGYRRQRKPLKNKLLRFEWNDSFDFSIEHPERIEDFKFNLLRIIKTCRRLSIPVILIKPKANSLFPPGAAKGNFIFYKYIGIRDKIAQKLAIQDTRFLQALREQEWSNYGEAKKRYKEILINSSNISSHPEYPLVVTNNYAVCAAEAGDFIEAEHLFKLLLKERFMRKEIALFNLAQLYKTKGETDQYLQYISDAYESDHSMYRVTKPYIEVIDQLATSNKPTVRVIDLNPLIADNWFVDHCHPVLEGQEIIKDKVVECLAQAGIKGAYKANINNALYNPELALGNKTEFFSYYNTYAPHTTEQIKSFGEKLQPLSEKESTKEAWEQSFLMLPDKFRSAINYYLTHPCFPSIKEILRFGPKYPSDVGRFPEFFLIRHVIPYLRVHERDRDLQNRFDPKLAILRSSTALVEVLPENVRDIVTADDPFLDPVNDSCLLDSILIKVKTALEAHACRGNQIFERLRTTIYWYFRESLRFGSHSRISMRYDRIFLEYCAEALAVAGVLDLRLGGEKSNEIKKMISALELIVQIHDQYCSLFSLQKDSTDILKEYDKQLFETAKSFFT